MNNLNYNNNITQVHCKGHCALWIHSFWSCSLVQLSCSSYLFRDKKILKKCLLEFPVLQMIVHCKMNCGADSRKISRAVELIMSFWMRATIFEFEARLVSKKHRPKKARKFLERKKDSQTQGTVVNVISFFQSQSEQIQKAAPTVYLYIYIDALVIGVGLTLL
jgi:hypothetical protein